MKRLFTNQIARLLWLLLTLVLVTGIVSAQNQNLLTNPGFEQPFATVAGSPPRQVAQGWSPWNNGGGQSTSENIQPWYYPASDVSNGLGIPRIRNGSDAQQYYSFFATHDGGLFQSVGGITQGAQLRFGAYVYVWSTTFDDPNKSEDPGGVVVQVGVDPTGGTDGSSANIVWSAPSIQYDAYNEYAVTASATSTTVTVWIRSTVTTPVKNTNIYVDDASLVVSGGTGGGATNTPVVVAPTNTNVPPTATNTIVVPTNTSIPATATSTATTVVLPASATPIPGQPTAIPTNTSIPVVPTNTSVPAVPTSTTAPAQPTATQESSIPTQESPTATPNGGVDNVQFPGRIVHIVRSGDTVGNLATLYGSNTDAIIAANNLPESALIKVGQGLVIPVRLLSPATSTPTPSPIAPVATSTTQVDVPAPLPGNIYIIQPGDTLSRIAARFNTTTATLAQLNGITNPNTIYYGQRLTIPVAGQDTGVTVPQPPAPTATSQAPAAEPTTYVVQRGDTLFKIAVRFNVTVAALAQANGIRNTNLVYTGQRLVIP
jgi:LysM repeat protein